MTPAVAWAPRLPPSWGAHDVSEFWRTVMGEASGEPIVGQQAVAWVVLNRAATARAYVAAHGHPHPLYGDGSIASTCDDPYQFSCQNRDDPNHRRITDAVGGDPPTTRPMQVALSVVLGDVAPPFGPEITHYHVATDPYPEGWKPKDRPADWTPPPPSFTIGHHAFYPAP